GQAPARASSSLEWRTRRRHAPAAERTDGFSQEESYVGYAGSGSHRSRDSRSDPRRGTASARLHSADPVGELRVPGRDGGDGFDPEQQVFGGLSGPPVLRRSGLYRPDRDDRDRAREGLVRRPARERAALLGIAGESGR